MFLFIFIYLLITYFFAFLYGFLTEEFSINIFLAFLWPVTMVLYPIGGTIYLTFTCGSSLMAWFRKPVETRVKKVVHYEDQVEVFIDDFGPLQFFVLRR